MALTIITAGFMFSKADYFFPRYPSRIKYIAGELDQTSHDLVFLNQKLKNLIQECDCKYAQSQCEQKGIASQPAEIEAIGEICPRRAEINQTKEEIKNKTDQVSFLKELLKKEMETGLKAELKTLREDEAKQLEGDLNGLIASSEKINSPALINIEITGKDEYSAPKNCKATCKSQTPSALNACIFNNVGEQSPIILKFSVGAALKELKLGEIGIKELGLNLPEKIELKGLGSIKNFKIPLPDLNISFPPTKSGDLGNLSFPSIVIHPPTPNIPILPSANFSCPKLKSALYQCQNEGEKKYDSSDNYFNITSATPKITVISPNGEENWEIGGIYNITWNSSGINKVAIELTSPSGKQNLASNISASSGRFAYTVSGVNPGSFYRIKILDANNPNIFDESKKQFSIVQKSAIKPSISILSPNTTGERIDISQSYHISWQYTGSPYYQIDILLAGYDKYGTQIGDWKLLTAGVSLSQKYYNWIPSSSEIAAAAKYKIKIREATDKANALIAVSDEYFFLIPPETLSSAITLVSPNGGEKLEAGKTYTIKWNAKNYPANASVGIVLVDERYDPNFGQGEMFIANTPNTGSYDWTAPPILEDYILNGSLYKIKVYINGGGVENSGSYTELEWYLQTFSWLSEKCQSIPTMKDEFGAPVKDKMNECFDKENVHLTIINECDSLWNKFAFCLATLFTECPPPTGICWSLGPQNKRGEVIKKECQNIFRQEGEAIPSSCGLETLKNKCAEIKKSGRADTPEPCKYLPIFTKQIEKPQIQWYDGSTMFCPSQEISDIPINGIRFDCPLSLPVLAGATPKIKLPDIIIPDIRLPTFNFSPFVKVKLPSFIFEDLKFPELKLCDLDNCKNFSNPLELNYPILMISDIEIPAFYISLPNGKTASKIEMGKIKFPPIPIPFPEIDLAKLISLKLSLPNIPLPSPIINLKFNGLDIDVTNILLGLVASILKIPSGCIGIGGTSGLPLTISFPDYYFYWPKFLEIPNLCNNEYMNFDKYCDNFSNLFYREAAKKIAQIQNIINRAFQENIQSKLDQIAAAIEETIKKAVNQSLGKIRDEIEEEIAEAIRSSKEEDGTTEIPPIKKQLEDILVPLEEKIGSLLAKIPFEVPISWPEELKNIKLKEPLTYQLPPIPLQGLSYNKEIPIPVPGLQWSSFKFSLDVLGNYSSFTIGSPSGGNPYPVDQITFNSDELMDISSEMDGNNETIDNIFNGGSIPESTTKTTPSETTPVTAPYINILSPNGGEELKTGRTYSIKWDNNHSSSANVRIVLRDKRGETTIADALNAGDYEWEVPREMENGSSYKVAIFIDEGGEGKYDESDSSFNITSSSCAKVYGNGPINIEFILSDEEVSYWEDGKEKKCQSNWTDFKEELKSGEGNLLKESVAEWAKDALSFSPFSPENFTIYWSEISNKKSCPNVFETVYLINECPSFRSYAFMNKHEIHWSVLDDRIGVLVHELGHSFAGLCDEYEEIGKPPIKNCPNCCQGCSKEAKEICGPAWTNSSCREGCNYQPFFWFRDAENDVMNTCLNAGCSFGPVDTAIINKLLGK